MTEFRDRPATPNLADWAEVIQTLRRKEGNWVGWGQACQQLQQAGFKPQQIFEETGFEPSQQNQIVVAAQVYQTLVNANAEQVVLDRFDRTGSDSLYELRVLPEVRRVQVATLAVEMQLDSEAVRQVVKEVREFDLLSDRSEDFGDEPGDAIAHQCWRTARQQEDLQTRSRWIARGLRFARSASARSALEKLLTDFTVAKPTQKAPRLPVYRLESVEEVPRIVPLAGQLPLAIADWKAVPLVMPEGVFDAVRFSGEGAWVALPNWQVLIQAEDPVALLASSDQLPVPLPDQRAEEVLLLLDRADRTWQADRFYAVDQNDHLELMWSPTAPTAPIVGRLLLVMRPKRIFDEANTRELWQVEE